MTYHVQFPGLGLALTVNRVAVSIGGFNIYWYGVIIAAGMMLALLYAFRNAVDFGIDSDRLVDVVAIGTVMAIVCARIYYVAMAPFKYNSIWEMIDIRLGGIAIYGAVIGAFVFGGWPPSGARSRWCRCSTWSRWASSSARASAAGATSSTRRPSALTLRCPGACTAREQKPT